MVVTNQIVLLSGMSGWILCIKNFVLCINFVVYKSILNGPTKCFKLSKWSFILQQDSFPRSKSGVFLTFIFISYTVRQTNCYAVIMHAVIQCNWILVCACECFWL